MTLTHLVLLLIVGVIFLLFFKQILSGDYPRRGVDYGNETSSTVDGKLNSNMLNNNYKEDRLKELLFIADNSINKKDYPEAEKALLSGLVLSPKNLDFLRRLGVVYVEMGNYSEAKKTYKELIKMEPENDLAHSSLANSLHKLGENDEAIKHHKKSIELDSSYAPNYYNYANTLYELKKFKEALKLYKKTVELDSSIQEAKKMVEKLERVV